MATRSYLLKPRRRLRQVCRGTGRDYAGKACPDCPIADLCERDVQAITQDELAR